VSAKILIADDETMMRELLAECLTSAEMEVIAVSSGPEALEKAAAIVPDLILLDVMMPGMDGFEVCRRLRQEPRLAEVPVILITALNDRESRLQGIEAGADDFVTKPYDSAELMARVKTITRLDRYRRLLAERVKFEWVVENSEAGYVLLDDDHRIVYANPAARIFLGRTGDGRPPAETFPELARRRYRTEPLEAWSDWPAASATARYLVRPESAEAGPLWLRLEVLDLPSRHDARRLVRLADETSKIVMKRDMWKFSSLVSHKLRTPLTTIIGGLEVLADDLDTAPREELAGFIEMATGGAQRLKEEIVRVLDTLKVSDLAREPGEGFAPEGLAALVTEVCRDLAIADPSVDVAAAAADRRLAVSPVAFELVLRELLGNAKKFHPKRAPSIAVRAVVAGRDLHLTVGDDGVHVPPELLARVWVPYFQNEKGFSGSVDGMGLGLSVVASVIWGVGGSCRIHNRENGPGIVVELAIPLAG
jgi:DNA-binding response OmpR family regulator